MGTNAFKLWQEFLLWKQLLRFVETGFPVAGEFHPNQRCAVQHDQHPQPRLTQECKVFQGMGIRGIQESSIHEDHHERVPEPCQVRKRRAQVMGEFAGNGSWGWVGHERHGKPWKGTPLSRIFLIIKAPSHRNRAVQYKHQRLPSSILSCNVIPSGLETRGKASRAFPA